jgi:hypothetical protein
MTRPAIRTDMRPMRGTVVQSGSPRVLSAGQGCPIEWTPRRGEGALSGRRVAAYHSTVALEVEVASLRAERDFYRKLLGLARNDELDPFLRDALALILRASAARRGYIELRDGDGDARWWMAHGFTDADV